MDFQNAKALISRHFDPSQRKLWTLDELQTALSENRHDWRLPGVIGLDAFVTFLVGESFLTEINLSFPKQEIIQYWQGAPSVYEIAASLQPAGYLSHHSAMYLHGLTETEPDTVYLNVEQSAKEKSAEPLTQSGLDAAFARPPRLSGNRAVIGERTICILSGKQTGGLGVTEIKRDPSSVLRVTCLERTLIDMTVRPMYSGGAAQALRAFQRVAGRVSVAYLHQLLGSLDHIYPYHQAIGFYLERAGGYLEEEIELFRSMPRDFDFYLEYQMQAPAYSEVWRLYYPNRLSACGST